MIDIEGRLKAATAPVLGAIRAFLDGRGVHKPPRRHKKSAARARDKAARQARKRNRSTR